MNRFLAPLAFLAMAAVSSAQTDKGYDLIHTDWNLRLLPATGKIEGDVTHTIKLTEDRPSIMLHMRDLTVEQVWRDGKVVEFGADSGLSVPITGVKSGQTIKVRVKYWGNPEAGVYFVPAERAWPAKTPMVYTQGEAEDTRCWMPIYDKPDDKATSSGHLTVPKDWQGLSNGVLQKVEKNGKEWTYHWNMKQPHATYLISFIAGPYEKGTEQWNGIPVEWWVPKGLRSMGESSFDGTAEMVEFFGKLTGTPYPYEKFAQGVVADYMYGGMENITLVTNTIGTLHEKDEKPIADSSGLVLHELAHQWFGDLVTCKYWNHIWINEGFASFLPSFYYRMRDGDGVFQMQRKGTIEGAMGPAVNPMIRSNYAAPMDNFDGNAYGGGAARLHMLMDHLGEQKFWAGIKAYLFEYRFKSATTEDFFTSMSRTSGEGLDWFRSQWFYTAGVPEVTVSRNGSQVVLTRTKGEHRLNVPVWVYSSGHWNEHWVDLRSGSGSLEVGDKFFLVDPEHRVMSHYPGSTVLMDAAEFAPAWRSCPSSPIKLLLWQVVGLDESVRREILRTEPSVWLKSQMLNQIGADSMDLLLSFASSTHRELAVAGVRRLAALDKNDQSQKRLEEVLRLDSNPRLRLEAMRVLVEKYGQSNLVERAWAIPATDEGFRRFALSWWVRQNADDGRTRCLAVLKSPVSEPVRVDAINHLAGLKDKSGSTEVYDALLKVAQENSFGARTAAIRALGDYGNPAAIPTIERAEKRGMLFVQRAAQEAIAKLRKAS